MGEQLPIQRHQQRKRPQMSADEAEGRRCDGSAGMAEFSRGGLGSNLLASLERDLIGFVCGSVAESRLVW
ncbi:hypothetical protein NKJ10_27005 [Mesorhizobium sp. M0204]|uniref:hypothetical protein n=1 Tax=Mesorhizobium sp. M0204 TaxID=2956913 RepID=UPI00333B4BE0